MQENGGCCYKLDFMIDYVKKRTKKMFKFKPSYNTYKYFLQLSKNFSLLKELLYKEVKINEKSNFIFSNGNYSLRVLMF